MRRETLITATERLAKDLQSTGVDKMIDESMERLHNNGLKGEKVLGISLEIFQKYAVAISTYGPVEHEVAKILEINVLFSADTWKRIALDNDPGFLFNIRNRINFAKIYLPKISKLLQQEHVAEAKGEGELPRELEGRTAITFILPEDEREYSTPGRLIAALEAITSIYSVHCTLEQQSETDLIVLACDSGSDKSFDFLGLAKIMEEVRKFVISIWDRRVFHRHLHASQCISLIAQSLPVIARIDELKQSGALPPEQAEILKRKTLHGATMFLESGIYIDEMAIETNHSPRQLMRPEPKLLAAPLPTEDGTLTTTSSELHSTIDTCGQGDLSPEEAAVLQHLLNKTRHDSGVVKPPEKKSAKSTKRKNDA